MEEHFTYKTGVCQSSQFKHQWLKASADYKVNHKYPK